MVSSTIYVPSKICVGYQKRGDTYTGYLAYVIYFDEKGKLRKEMSWKTWRDERLGVDDYDNVPTSGFVLNKKVGGYKSDWNFRQAYCRVYDPRGFELEITVPNLLYILENSNCIKGKGLEGEFVYAWDGQDLVLLPVDSPDYAKIAEYADARQHRDKISAKTMVVGGTYLTKGNETVVYLGKFMHYKNGAPTTEKHWFYHGDLQDTKHGGAEAVSSLSGILRVVSEASVPTLAFLVDKMMSSSSFSPPDPTKTEFVVYTLERWREKHSGQYRSTALLANTAAAQRVIDSRSGIMSPIVKQGIAQLELVSRTRDTLLGDAQGVGVTYGWWLTLKELDGLYNLEQLFYVHEGEWVERIEYLANGKEYYRT